MFELPIASKKQLHGLGSQDECFYAGTRGLERCKTSDPKTIIEEKTDKVALTMIYQGIPEDVLLSLAEKKTAKDAWEAIRTLCLGVDRVKKARIQTLKSEFEALCMKDSE